MSNEKLKNQHTEKHKNHQMCLQQVVGNGVTHIGLFCKQCKVGGTNAWITWLDKKEVKYLKKKMKIKELPTRKSK